MVMHDEQTVAHIDAVIPELKEDFAVSVDEFAELLEYRSNLQDRARLYKNFTDENGRFTMYEKGTPRDKDTLNQLSHKITNYARKIVGTPIYDKLREEMNLPEFLRETKFVATQVGWYQNSKGDLYHYDGTIWDDVPEEKISDLEFLGG